MTVYKARSDLAPSVSLIWAPTTLPILSSALSTLNLTSGLCICSSFCLKCFPQDLCMSYLLISFRSFCNCCFLRESFVDHPNCNSSPPPPCTLKAALGLPVVTRHWAFCYRWKKTLKCLHAWICQAKQQGAQGKGLSLIPIFQNSCEFLWLVVPWLEPKKQNKTKLSCRGFWEM